MTTLTITPEFSTDELQDLIDGLPPYWTSYWMDDEILLTIINSDNLILIDTEYTPYDLYSSKSYINWIDGSYWIHYRGSEFLNGPYPYGPETPPIHTCETPMIPGGDIPW